MKPPLHQPCLPFPKALSSSTWLALLACMALVIPAESSSISYPPIGRGGQHMWRVQHPAAGSYHSVAEYHFRRQQFSTRLASLSVVGAWASTSPDDVRAWLDGLGRDSRDGNSTPPNFPSRTSNPVNYDDASIHDRRNGEPGMDDNARGWMTGDRRSAPLMEGISSSTAAIPEPSVSLLVMLGVMATLRRRRIR